MCCDAPRFFPFFLSWLQQGSCYRGRYRYFLVGLSPRQWGWLPGCSRPEPPATWLDPPGGRRCCEVPMRACVSHPWMPMSLTSTRRSRVQAPRATSRSLRNRGTSVLFMWARSVHGRHGCLALETDQRQACRAVLRDDAWLNARCMTQAVDMLEVVAPLCYVVEGDVRCPSALASPASVRFVERAVAEMDTPKTTASVRTMQSVPGKVSRRGATAYPSFRLLGLCATFPAPARLRHDGLFCGRRYTGNDVSGSSNATGSRKEREGAEALAGADASPTLRHPRPLSRLASDDHETSLCNYPDTSIAEGTR